MCRSDTLSLHYRMHQQAKHHNSLSKRVLHHPPSSWHPQRSSHHRSLHHLNQNLHRSCNRCLRGLRRDATFDSRELTKRVTLREPSETVQPPCGLFLKNLLRNTEKAPTPKAPPHLDLALQYQQSFPFPMVGGEGRRVLSCPHRFTACDPDQHLRVQLRCFPMTRMAILTQILVPRKRNLPHWVRV